MCSWGIIDLLLLAHCRKSSGSCELSRPVARDQEVVLDAQPAAARPVHAGLDREDHVLAQLAGPGLVSVRRLVSAGADAVRDRMRGLARVADLGESGPDQPVEFGQAGARLQVVDRPPKTPSSPSVSSSYSGVSSPGHAFLVRSHQ